MTFQSINPYNQEIIQEHKAHTSEEVEAILNRADKVFHSWKTSDFEQRSVYLLKAAELLERHVTSYARVVSLEMGKVLPEAKAEVKKCAWVCRYYAENAADFLAKQHIKTDARQSYVEYAPLGAILAIMPWNFPFWQVFRFAAPTIMAGNTAVLKHASNVFGCAKLIEQIFQDAGFPEGVFQNLFIHHDNMESVIAHDAIKAVTLTGSERAGKSVASLAGKYLKKSLLELGGSNAFIVMEDADIDRAVQTGITARMMNAGQSCIAAKRFIAIGKAYEPFVEKFTEAARDLKYGDQMDDSVKVGPMARIDLAEELQNQLQESLKAGAKLLLGGNQKGAMHQPTVIEKVQPGMPAFDQETFGPLAAIMYADNINEAIQLANQSKYGLGVTLFTGNPESATQYTSRFKDGAVFINDLVKSDPRLPFGGTGFSGYGRELAREGILEFVNVKTVYVAG